MPEPRQQKITLGEMRAKRGSHETGGDMKKLLILLVSLPSPAFACAPSPSCWITESPRPAYLRSICLEYNKKNASVTQIELEVDEPEKTPDFVKACKKLGISFIPGGHHHGADDE
jgi:hypothetical protein